MAEEKNVDLKVFGSIVLFCIIAIILARGNWLFTSWGEKEGRARYEDCRNKITIQEGSSEAWFKNFTCSYVKTQSGKVLSGTCVHVVTEGQVCQMAYIYYKKSQVVCNDPKLPFPAYDDKCHAAPP